MKTTRYFDEQVLRKRPYLKLEWCERALVAPIARLVQPDGRIRHWLRVDLSGQEKFCILLVVTLEDGQTVHNAFFDRDYREAGS